MIGAVIVTLAGVHGAVWWVVGGRLIDGVAAFKAEAANEGWQIETGPGERAAWPWAAAIRLPGVVARRNLGGTILEWRAERVEVRLSPADPGAVRISASGEQALGFSPGTMQPIRALATWVRAPLSGDAPMTFEARDVTAGAVRVGLLNGQVASRAFGLTASPVTLSPSPAPPFDQGFAVSIGVALNRALHDAASPRETAAAWQAEGGRLSIPNLELTWGPVHLTGSGAGGLDPRLQPFGQATLHLQGGPEVLDALARAGLVAPGPASAIRGVLGLLVLASPGGEVTVPVTLEDSTLTAAHFPLARLPQVAW